MGMNCKKNRKKAAEKQKSLLRKSDLFAHHGVAEEAVGKILVTVHAVTGIAVLVVKIRRVVFVLQELMLQNVGVLDVKVHTVVKGVLLIVLLILFVLLV